MYLILGWQFSVLFWWTVVPTTEILFTFRLQKFLVYLGLDTQAKLYMQFPEYSSIFFQNWTGIIAALSFSNNSRLQSQKKQQTQGKNLLG